MAIGVMKIQFWWLSVWHEILYIFNTGSTLIMSMIMICLCVLWIVFLIIYHVYGPLNSIAMILRLKYNYILYFWKIEAVSFHNFMIVVTWILDLVSCFMLYSSCMILWFFYSSHDIPVFHFDFTNLYVWKRFPSAWTPIV